MINKTHGYPLCLCGRGFISRMFDVLDGAKCQLIYMSKNIDKSGSLFWIITGYVAIFCIGIVDTLMGSEISFSLFYLIPIILVTWFSGKYQGFIICVIGAAVWFTADVLAGHSYSLPIIPYWNALVRLGFFVVVTMLIPALKALEREKGIARTDHLTGAGNRRHFFEVAQTEIDRSQRYKRPFTIAYMDLDGFKTVNDQWGHITGDKILCAVVNRIKRHVRKTDIIARLGGDEFVILLPETNQDAAKIAIPKIQNILIDEMRRNDWPVSFSIGVLTCLEAKITPDELIKRADNLMYAVKKNGKNAIAYEVFAG
jgi:diguanylate cyclase (GGDEF)-like protein